MDKIQIKITKEQSGKEIKSILFDDLKLSSRLVTELKKDFGIMLNGEKATVRKKVLEGDELILTLPLKKSENIVPNDIPLDIIFEDDDILVINKPSGMPTHPSHGHFENTLANGVMHYFKNSDFTFRAITRLDRDTTGLVLIAKNQISANILCNELKEKQIEKTYLAICMGELPDNSGTIIAPIARVCESVIKREVSKKGQYAETEYSVSAYENGYSLVTLKPKTGRTHQIRVHLSHIGNPIYADFIYGTELSGERTRLHCHKLKFKHPKTGENIELIAPLPNDFFITPYK